MAKPTRTTNRLHFTDLSATRFEDLAMQLVYRLKGWEEIHHDGRTGTDEGVDIRAIERLEDQSLRHWHVQCRRYAEASGATLKRAVDDALEKAKTPPDVLLVIVACDVSLKARTEYEQYARANRIQTPLVWPASTLEARLYSDYPEFLFTFFGISLARQERSRETNLKRNFVMKRRLARVFTANDHGTDIIVHSVDDDSYPNSGKTPPGQISGWFGVEFCGHYFKGFEVYLSIVTVVIERETDLWAVIDYQLSQKVDAERFVTPNAFRIGRIPFRNIVELDEDGDEYYPGPHLYCKFADDGQPYESLAYKLTEDKYERLDPNRQQSAIVKALPPKLMTRADREGSAQQPMKARAERKKKRSKTEGKSEAET